MNRSLGDGSSRSTPPPGDTSAERVANFLTLYGGNTMQYLCAMALLLQLDKTQH